jgi:hypothetical protein
MIITMLAGRDGELAETAAKWLSENTRDTRAAAGPEHDAADA